MRRGHTARVSDRGVRAVADLVEDELEWIFRDQPVQDYGIDAHAEIETDDELVTGRLIALQIKSGSSWFDEETADGWVFRPNADHIAYWLGHSLPVIVVLVDTDRKAYWQVVSTSSVTETKKAYKLTVPRNQPFDRSARDALLEIGGRSETLIGSLPGHYRVLPPDSVSNLRRAAKVDPLAAARLADRLAAGRAEPAMTAASVTAAQPTWLADSDSAQDLWCAVAAYAGEHTADREAAAAFRLAAAAEGPRSARANAFGGLSLVFVDRPLAAELLGRARDGGQTLLADVGFMILDVLADVAGEIEVPKSIREASEAQLDGEPTVLNALGEVEVRRGDLTAAIAYRQRAVDASSEPHSGIRLELARNIWQRAMREGNHSPQERRRAVGHAQAAVEDRRRWAGPSADALTVLVELLVTNAEFREAVRAALPISQGGTALEIESVSPSVARLGALAALADGNAAALSFFRQLLPAGPRLRELTALETEAELSPSERVAMWAELVQKAEDDATAARFVPRLVRLGVWPEAADSLARRKALPQVTLEILRAEYLARTTDHELGTARLRELILSDAQAVHVLVIVLEDHSGPDAAIQECEEQLRSRPDPITMVLLADLLRRHKSLDRAEEVSAAIVSNDALSDDMRLQACKWLVSRNVERDQYSEAATLAKTGLAVREDPDLAWNLLAAVHNAGDVVQAREILARYRPEPTTEAEIRLWMQLHIGVPLPENDAPLMADLVRRLPPGDLRGAIIGHLVSEVLHAPVADQRTYPPSITESVKEFANEIGDDSRGARKIKSDDEALRAALQRDQVDPVAAQRNLDQLRSGLRSSAEIAQLVRVPYGAALLQSPAGLLFASDLSTGLRRTGEAAARDALAAGRCVVDLPDVGAAGVDLWLSYLQLRYHAAMESENIAALRYARAWQVDAARYSPLGTADPRVARGMSGRGHILQMFGHYDAAIRCFAAAARHAAHFQARDDETGEEHLLHRESLQTARAQLAYTEVLRNGDRAKAIRAMRGVHAVADTDDRVEIQFTRERRSLELALGFAVRRNDLAIAVPSRRHAQLVEQQFERFVTMAADHPSPNRLLAAHDITLLYAVLTRDAELAHQARDAFERVNNIMGGYANLTDRFNSRLRAAKTLSKKFRDLPETSGPADPLRRSRATPTRATGLLVAPDHTASG
ncbi:hypothetical protein GCM10011609_35660 [Lentzea pudingi]|uniref:DUF4365 domain-containing protein n=1 Tax=Lentzea pudingi TaxID=1789439 RepID=A0ABQ2HZ41_9PSEU|nr:DUF4365 domain-containing protein [Lentzea pudingi]GGM95009.1 hypothetical protein GCM10011609_35660 [Lentzea pudingi]